MSPSYFSIRVLNTLNTGITPHQQAKGISKAFVPAAVKNPIPYFLNFQITIKITVDGAQKQGKGVVGGIIFQGVKALIR